MTLPTIDERIKADKFNASIKNMILNYILSLKEQEEKADSLLLLSHEDMTIVTV